MDFAYKMRCMVFNEWLRDKVNIKRLCKKYGFSRKWFYKYKKRFLKYGFEGLKDKERPKPVMPHALPLDKKISIMDYVYESPTHGPRRINMELKRIGISISEGAIYNHLLKEGLNTRRKRRIWAYKQGKPVLTEREKQSLIWAKTNHIESKYPGELISMDTFTASVKGLGKLWQFTACDTYSSYGWAKVYYDKTASNSLDFFINHILKNCPDFKIKRILTDQGVEFYTARHPNVDGYFTSCLKTYGIKHTVTKKAHPWTNGYAERLNHTIWQEFYLCRLTVPFASIEALNKDLSEFMRYYNFERMHTGYKLKQGGYQFPGHAFFDVKEAKNIIEIKY